MSLDKSHDDFQRAHALMPWPAVPYEKTQVRRLELASRFGVCEKQYREGKITGKIVVVTAKGKILNNDAYGAMTSETNYESFPWEVKEGPNKSIAACAVQCLDQVSSCTIC